MMKQHPQLNAQCVNDGLSAPGGVDNLIYMLHALQLHYVKFLRNTLSAPLICATRLRKVTVRKRKPEQERHAMLKDLMKAERKAYRALMNDPKVIADPKSTHTPSLIKAWDEACAAERSFREAHDL